MLPQLNPCVTDAPLYAALPVKEKAKVKRRAEALCRILAAERPLEQARREAAAGVEPYKTLERLYYAVRNGGDWTVLANQNVIKKATGATAGRGLPGETIAHWQELCLANQRKLKPAHRALEREWRAGQEIPGIGTWRDWWRETHGTAPPAIVGFAPDLPEGLSYKNLMTHKPDAGTLTLAQHGKKKFREKHVPLVLRTRVGLEPGRVWMCDDVWWDNRTTHGAQDVRPLELGIQDVASAYQFVWGMRPLREKEFANGKKEGLQKREFLSLLACALIKTGFHPEGLRIVCEHGTAAISKDVEKALHDLSGGKITVQRGAIQGAAFLDQFRGASVGNSMVKAMKESLHNLLHNEAGALPGQMGKDWKNAPEQLKGITEYNKTLLLVAQSLPAKYREALEFPVLEWTSLMQAATEIYARIHERRDHNLEGWEENGWVTMQWRLGPGFPWQDRSDYHRIPPGERAGLDAVIKAPGNHRMVKLSPREVWKMHESQLVKLPAWTLPMIVGDHTAKPITLKTNRTFVIQDREISSEPLVYAGELTDLEGNRRWLNGGETYAVWVNGFMLDTLVVGTPEGGVLGTCRRDVRAGYADAKAQEVAMGQSQRRLIELATPYAKLSRKNARERQAMHEHNIAVLEAAKAAGDGESLAGGDVAARVVANSLAAADDFRADEPEQWN